MTEPGSPTVRRRRLAAELREIRESRGRSGESVAAALGWSPSKISRYERAKTGLRPREVERLLSYYQVTGQRRALLLALAEDATHKGWWEDSSDVLAEDYKQFIGLEHEANSIAIWHVDVVAGLLQTEAYARHIIGSYSRIEPVAPGMIGRLVRVRMRRQQAIDRADLELSVVFDESILQRRIGDDVVMYEQLQHLAKVAERPNVTMQILTLDGQHRVFGESFVIFGFGADSEAMLQERRRHRAHAQRLHAGGGAGDVPAPDRVRDARRGGARPAGVQGAHPRDGGIALAGALAELAGAPVTHLDAVDTCRFLFPTVRIET